MNLWLLVASVLVMGAALAHSLLGEKVVLRRVFRRHEPATPGQNRRSADDPLTQATLRLVWHSLSLALMGFAGVLLQGAFDVGAYGSQWNGVMWLLSGTFAGLAALSLVMARGRHIGWMWFAAVAVATWMSVR